MALSTEDRLDRLESRNQLQELITGYATACDYHDMTRLASYFTDDATIHSVDGKMQAGNKKEIMAMFRRMFAIRGPSYHWSHDLTLAIDANDPNKGTGVVLGHAETTPNNIVSLAAMKYRDTYRREGGRWLFASRELSFLYYMPASAFSERFKDKNRILVHPGEAYEADYPEKLPTWVIPAE